ncbi:MAG: aryl-sulfate sulfotransferase [bacterium]|nr:aryl-sulfate sulfotransferase [bacterium]
MNTTLLASIAVALTAAHASAQAPGLRLFQSTPASNEPSRLVDDQGVIVHQWPGAALISHIAPDGQLVRGAVATGSLGIAGQTGQLQRLAFDGTINWDYEVDGPEFFAHHDLEIMPNGNILAIVWDGLTVPDAIAAGRNPATVSGTVWLPDAVLELEPTGLDTADIVWQWRLHDHLIQDFDATKANFGTVANHPELVDINYPPTLVDDGDWNHFNGIDYDPIHDLIILSSRVQNEIYIIDHSTTTAEAAGHTGGNYGKGGDILWRWGNPAAYRAGTVNDQILDFQHDPRFIPPGVPGAGNITVFNNRWMPNRSAIHELTIPTDAQGNFFLDPQTGRYGPSAPTWNYSDPSFYSAFASGSERLPNGNTLICSAQQARIFEIDMAGQTVWTYQHTTAPWLFQANYIDRSLWANTNELPVSGGRVNFENLQSSGFTNHYFLLLGSFTGTGPGTLVPGGVRLPLNVDFLTASMATSFNTGIFSNTVGTFDSLGGSTSSLVVPPGFIPPQLAGATMHFAHLAYGSNLVAARASNPVQITIVP